MRPAAAVGRGARIVVALGTLLALVPAPAGAERLPIAPVIQQTHVWCWVAVGEMVFRHARVANVNPARSYQCGIIGLLAGGTVANACASRCELCAVPAGSAERIRTMLEDYPQRVGAFTGRPTPRIQATYRTRALLQSQIVDEIGGRHPVVAGISPAGRPAAGSAHVALIVGQEDDGATLIVNDPYPFPGFQNPYLAVGAQTAGRPGSYRVSYDAFRRRLNWTESFTVRIAGPIAGGEGGGPAPGPPLSPASSGRRPR